MSNRRIQKKKIVQAILDPWGNTYPNFQVKQKWYPSDASILKKWRLRIRCRTPFYHPVGDRGDKLHYRNFIIDEQARNFWLTLS